MKIINKTIVKSRVPVKMHQRKIDGEPTQEILDYVAKNKITLKKGHTLVRRHSRKVDKVQNTEIKQIKKPNDVREDVDFGDINLLWTDDK